MSVDILLGALLAGAAVVFVALPLLGAEPLPPLESGDEWALAAEERDRALAELKELEFDHRTGKISDDDYRALVQPLRQRAAQMLNGSALSNETRKSASEQHFSDASLPDSRSDR